MSTTSFTVIANGQASDAQQINQFVDILTGATGAPGIIVNALQVNGTVSFPTQSVATSSLAGASIYTTATGNNIGIISGAAGGAVVQLTSDPSGAPSTDTNINLQLVPKGRGAVTISGESGVGHLACIGTPQPTLTAGANAGTSPPAPVRSTTCTDVSGSATFGTGTGPSAGAQVVVTFGSVYGFTGTTIGPFVVVTPLNAATYNLGIYVTSVSATSFTLATVNAPAASQANTTYSFSWIVFGV